MTDTTVANTIWQQISRSTKMACGARQPIASDDNTLTFHVTVKPGKAYYVRVRLVNDLYTVELITRRGVVTNIEKSVDGIYNDQLSEVIYDFCNKDV